MPVARAHAVAAPAHRRLARDRAAGTIGRRRRRRPQAQALRGLYDHAGIDTCAGCGLCATACPVDIETGLLIKQLRGRAAGPLAHRVADRVAQHFGAVTAGVRLGLGAADLLHGVVGTGAMKGALDGLRTLSGGRLPKWSPTLARPVHFTPPRRAGGRGTAPSASSISRAAPRARWARSAATGPAATPRRCR